MWCLYTCLFKKILLNKHVKTMTPPLSIWFTEAGINNNGTTCNEEPHESINAGRTIYSLEGFAFFLSDGFFTSLAFSVYSIKWFLLLVVGISINPNIRRLRYSPKNMRPV